MEEKNLEKIHPKFAREFQCAHCGGYHLVPEGEEKPESGMCEKCIERGWDKEINPDDVLHTDVNVQELAKQVAQLQAELKKVTAQPIKLEKKRKIPTSFKPKDCSCGKEFTPLSPAQKVCQDCRDKLIS